MPPHLIPETLARLLIYEVIVWLPLVLVVIALRNPDAGVLLLSVFFLAVPSVLGALFVFVPLETVLGAYGLERPTTPAVALGAVVTGILVACFRGPAKSRGDRLRIAPWFALWCGISWRLSDGVMRWIAQAI